MYYNRITALEDTFEGKRISVQLKSENGSEISQIFDVPANISVKQLQSLLDTVLKTVNSFSLCIVIHLSYIVLI